MIAVRLLSIISLVGFHVAGRGAFFEAWLQFGRQRQERPRVTQANPDQDRRMSALCRSEAFLYEISPSKGSNSYTSPVSPTSSSMHVMWRKMVEDAFPTSPWGLLPHFVHRLSSAAVHVVPTMPRLGQPTSSIGGSPARDLPRLTNTFAPNAVPS